MTPTMCLVLVAFGACLGTSSAYLPWTPRTSEDGLMVPHRGPYLTRRGPPPYVRVARSLSDDAISQFDEEYPLEDIIEERRFKRSADEQRETEEHVSGEIIQEKDIPKDAQKIEVSEQGEYEEILSENQQSGRSKRATVTVIRIRNRRTGRVTYIVIRRR